jgi:hypothetical protein
MRTRAALVVAAAVLAVSAGCAAPAEDSAAPGAPGSPTSASPSSTFPGENLPVPTSKPPRPEEPSPPAGGEITVTGKVVAGVEPGCKVLVTDGKSYLLVAEGTNSTALREGATVEVRGTVQADMMTTCMEGTPLVVSSVKPG